MANEGETSGVDMFVPDLAVVVAAKDFSRSP